MASPLAGEPRPPQPRSQELRELYENLPRLGAAQLLGVPKDADPAAARAAFVQLARRFHPDVLATEDPGLRELAQEVFIALDDAYRQLGGHRAGRRTAPVASAREHVRATLAPAPAASAEEPVQRQEPPQQEPAPANVDPTAAVASGTEVEREALRRRAHVDEALQAAGLALERGDAASAVATLHQVISLAEEGDRRPRLLLARAYLSDPQYRRYGLELLREMTAGARPDARALALLGGLYHREGLLVRAESTLMRALAVDPGDPEARAELQRLRARHAGSREGAARPGRPGLFARILSFRR